jgi:hypothetical protein
VRLPWQGGTGGVAGEPAAQDVVSGGVPVRARRWRRALGGALRAPIAEPAVTTGTLVVVEPAVDVAAAGAGHPVEPARPGLVAVAIARTLIAIDFAISGGGRPRR